MNPSGDVLSAYVRPVTYTSRWSVTCAVATIAETACATLQSTNGTSASLNAVLPKRKPKRSQNS
jgi:hypothetical protein